MRFEVTKRMSIACAHRLELPYPSKCANFHGHNFEVDITVGSEQLNQEGMVADFSLIKEAVNHFDHEDLNELVSGEGENPTSEWLAIAIEREVQRLLDLAESEASILRIKVRESDGNEVLYTP